MRPAQHHNQQSWSPWRLHEIANSGLRLQGRNEEGELHLRRLDRVGRLGLVELARQQPVEGTDQWSGANYAAAAASNRKWRYGGWTSGLSGLCGQAAAAARAPVTAGNGGAVGAS